MAEVGPRESPPASQLGGDRSRWWAGKCHSVSVIARDVLERYARIALAVARETASLAVPSGITRKNVLRLCRLRGILKFVLGNERF